MKAETLVWKSRFRPWLERTRHRVWPFSRDALGFATALGLGWAAAWLAFGRLQVVYTLPFFLVMLAFPTGAVLAAAYRTWNRTHPRSARRAWVLTALGIGATTVALHFVRDAPRRFAFLGETSIAFSAEPGLPIYTEAIYTFPSELRTSIRRARPELRAAGYEIRERNGRLEADKSRFDEPLPGSSWLVPDTVEIFEGRTVGVRSLGDLNPYRLGPEKGWTTVCVDQPERLPLWLRVFVP